MSGTKMMRQARKHPFAAAALLCALAAGSVQAQAPAPAAAPAKPTSGFLPPASSSANVIDAIAVVVNDDIITRNELAQRVRSVAARRRQAGGAVPDESVLQRQVLERMIVERAQQQLGKEMGVRVDDGTLDRAIGRIAEQQKLSLQEFRNAIEKEGTPYAAFREEIRNEIIVQRLREHEVDNKIQVSEAEVDSFLAAEQAAAADRVEVNLAQILVRIPDNASPEQIAARKARADEVLRQLRTGADFAKMAATYSDASDALQGGAIGWRDPRNLPPVFADALAKLAPGQATPAIRSQTGFHILKLVERRSAAAKKEVELVQQTRARHILIKVTPTMSATEAKRKLAEMKERIENKAAKFEDLARQFSGDSSAAKGGDLGWMAPGDIVPEFETVMNKLKVGEISDVVETPFGYHLIEVLERKADDQSVERERAAARMALRERKLVEASEDWERQLRDRAYVEFRLDDK
jgi:peptidyl-prolyl cis-trans isomerase SurA